MNTVELHCIIHADKHERQNIADILVAQLSEQGYQSFMDTSEGLKAYIPENSFDPATLDQLMIHRMYPGKIEWQHQTLVEKNWNEVWEKNFQPVVVDGQCLIRATFHEAQDDFPYELVIEPKMSFGTGHHPTTYLMIQWLLETDLNGRKVLDMGSGTGILAILSSKKGASEVWAIDNNEWAYQNAVENTRINQSSNVKVIQGTINSIGGATFDLMVANINLTILQQDIPDYAGALKHNGILIISGIYEHDMKKIIHHANNHGLKYFGHKENNSWVALAFQKSPKA